MFTKHKKLTLVVLLLGTVVMLSLFLSPAKAQGMQHRMSGHGEWWSDSNIPAKYQLSSEQIGKIKEITSKFDDEIIPLQRDLRALRTESRGYTSRSDAEIGKIKSYREDINNLEGKIEDLRLESKAEINKVLTEEQQAYFGDNFGFGNFSGNMCSEHHSDMNSCDGHHGQGMSSGHKGHGCQ
ncbi:MAG: hypothetical protein M1480_00135 [Bacteroidetes bacterium]|nr:hypothetical protein [Bacteroidota bacterium]